MSMERSEVQFGRTSIPYAIDRGHRVKTVAIGVDPLEGVQVRAPRGTPIARLDAIVHSKAQWIIARQRRHSSLPPPPAPRQFVSGETFLYLGRQYRLRIVQADGPGARVRLVGRYLLVPVANKLLSAHEARESLVAWYRGHAAARLPERVEAWAKKVSVKPTSVRLSNTTKRWASADFTGNLRFSWRIVQASTRLIDYVIAHELVHLEQPDHTRSFWAKLGRVMPDYEARKDELRGVGTTLVW
jgi:predicted metal-dependent hydrolase